MLLRLSILDLYCSVRVMLLKGLMLVGEMLLLLK